MCNQRPLDSLSEESCTVPLPPLRRRCSGSRAPADIGHRILEHHDHIQGPPSHNRSKPTRIDLTKRLVGYAGIEQFRGRLLGQLIIASTLSVRCRDWRGLAVTSLDMPPEVERVGYCRYRVLMNYLFRSTQELQKRRK